MWNSEVVLRYLMQCISWICLWFLFVFQELHNSAIACYRTCSCPSTEMHVFWRDVSKHFLLPISFTKIQLPRFPAVLCRQWLMTMKKLHQHWCTPSWTENICCFKDDQAEELGEQCSCFQRCPLQSRNLEAHPVTALWKQSNTEIQFKRLSALEHAHTSKMSCVQTPEA